MGKLLPSKQKLGVRFRLDAPITHKVSNEDQRFRYEEMPPCDDDRLGITAHSFSIILER